MNLKPFKQFSHKRSKRESGIKHSSYYHKPHKERQEALDEKHERSRHLWKIRRSQARKTKDLVSNNSPLEKTTETDDTPNCDATSVISKDYCGDCSFVSMGDRYDSDNDYDYNRYECYNDYHSGEYFYDSDSESEIKFYPKCY
jgi:hypothetical protein